MKNLSHKIVGVSLTAVILSVVTGCASVSPATQANEQTSQTVAQVEKLPNVRLITTPQKTKANLERYLKTSQRSMEFEDMPVESVLDVLSQSGDFSILLDKNITLNRKITVRLMEVTLEETLNTLLSYDCLSYKIIDNHTIYIYKDPKNVQCHAQPIAPDPNKALLNSSPMSMDLTAISLTNWFALLGKNINTNIAIDNQVSPHYIGLYQLDVQPRTLFNRIMEANCLTYRKTGENTLFIYQPTQTQCSFTPLAENELAKIPNLQQLVSFDEKPALDYRGQFTNFGQYLSKIRESTQIAMVSKDIINDYSKNYGKIQVKANNQPAYKVLQSLATANCFDIAQLSDKSLFLFPKPTSAKCEPVKNGTTITVE